ncbi:DDE-type integrase/transposase/recombinase [Dactylosporangium darangshiense]|uniref:DDE domain-containing protein n=1 Tax=Dactylosporangium darangshiense TaxID=579108 RepID=A0ABP8DV60_9ACTN
MDKHGRTRAGFVTRRVGHPSLATLKVRPTEVVTDAAPVYPAVLDELAPSAWRHVERYANNRIEADHSQLKHRLRPMRGLRTNRTVQTIIAGHAFMQNLRRGHCEIGLDAPRAPRRRGVHRARHRYLKTVALVKHALRSANATAPPRSGRMRWSRR